MMRSKFGLLGLVLGGLLLLGTQAHAIPVTYTAQGSFGAFGPGSNVFTSMGVTITYNSPNAGLPQTVDANPTTNASFGNFNTTGTTAMSPVTISTPFTLRIFQVAPTAGGPIDFIGQISGTLSFNSGTAVLQLNGPLTQSIGLVNYQIANASDGVPGRILIAPPATNNGVTAIEGRITAIPEPSAMVLVGMGAVAPLAMVLRRRVKARAQA